MSVTWRSFGTRPFPPLAGSRRSPAKRGREKRRSFRHASSLLASGQTKPQFAKVLTAYRSKAVSSSTALPTSPKGPNSKMARRSFAAASASTDARVRRSTATWQVRRKSPALSRRRSICVANMSIRPSCAPQRIFPCSTLGRRIPLARLTQAMFRRSMRRSAPLTSFRA